VGGAKFCYRKMLFRLENLDAIFRLAPPVYGFVYLKFFLIRHNFIYFFLFHPFGSR